MSTVPDLFDNLFDESYEPPPKSRFDLTKRLGSKRILEFAEYLNRLQAKVGFKMSSRGWAYALERAQYFAGKRRT